MSNTLDRVQKKNAKNIIEIFSKPSKFTINFKIQIKANRF